MYRTPRLLKYKYFARFFEKMDVVLYTLYIAVLPKCKH